MRKFLITYRFPLILLACILIGAQLGNYLGGIEGGKEILKNRIKPLGDIFLNFLFMILVPLVFSSIASAVANMGNAKRLGKVMSSMLIVFVITGIIASVIMVLAVLLFPLGEGLSVTLPSLPETEPLDPVQQIVKAITVTDFSELLSKKNMLPLIIFSVLIGLAVNQLGEKAKPFKDFLNASNEVMMKIIHYIMYLAPVGLLAYFAYLTGTFGNDLMSVLKRAVLIYFPVSIGYFFLFFSIYAYWAGGKKGFTAFWKNVTPPALVALATGSSMATIPSNLEAAEKSGVPKDISEMVIPIGATIHMDGSCLSAVLKIALLFSLYGQDFTTFQTISTAIGVGLLSGIVMSGIPGGGKIGELLIVSLYGFPVESMILVSSLGDVIDAPATAVNAVGDNVASMMVARMVEGEEWMIRE
jgi:Na+/H+-dicarboxylate symporter